MYNHKKTKISILITIAALISAILISFSLITVSAEESPVSPKLNVVSVSLDGQVNLKFKYSDLGDADSFKVEIFGKEPYFVPANEIPLINSDRVISVKLLPTQMTSEVTVTPYFGDVAGAPVKQSVRGYVDKLLAAPDHVAYHDTARALLNWGSFVEKHFINKYDDTAEKGIFANDTNPIHSVTAIPYIVTDKTNLTDSFKNGEVSLSFGTSNTSLNFYIDYEGDFADDLYITLYDDGVMLGNFRPQKLTDDKYSHRFSIKNVGISNFESVYSLVITDGHETVTLEKSVLEYLAWNISPSSQTTDGEKNICRSFYQLYQLAMNEINPSCPHGVSGSTSEKDTYMLVSGENKSYVKCAHCFKQLSQSPIANSVNRYLPNATMSLYTTLADGNDGYSKNDSGRTDHINVKDAEFLVIKTKSSASNISLVLSTAAVNGYGTVSFAAGGENVYVIKLGSIFSGKYAKTSGNYIIDTFYLSSGSPSDIEYMAFAADWTEIKELIGNDTTVRNITSSSGTYENVSSDGRCTNGCTVVENKKTVGTNYVYTRTCSNCSTYSETKTVPTSVKFHMSFRELCDTNGKNYQLTESVSGSVYRLIGTGIGGQELLTRSYLDSDKINNGTKYNVGTSSYFIIKAKASNARKISLTFSTTAVNRWNGTEEKRTAETGYGTSYNSNVNINLSEDWQTFVFNAADIATLYYKDESGNYVIDTLIIGIDNFGTEEWVDIEYLAIANDWDDIDAVVNERTVQYVTTRSGDVVTLNTDGSLPCDGVHIRYNFTEHWYDECEEHGIPQIARTAHTYSFYGLFYSCSDCGFVPACNGEHTISAKDDKTHSSAPCTHCGYAGDSTLTEAHTFTYGEDNEYECSLCEHTPSCNGDHEYTVNSDGTHSMKACSVCGAAEIKNQKHICEYNSNHIYICKICKLEPTCCGEHEYITTADSHYISACSECGYGGSEHEEHVNSNCSDYYCDICGFKLTTGHTDDNRDGRCDRCYEDTADKGAYVLTPDMLLDMTSTYTVGLNGEGSSSLTLDDGSKVFRVYGSPTGTSIGNYWINNPADLRRSAVEGTPLNVGSSRFIVLKIRDGKESGESYRIHISTYEVNSTSESDKDGTSSVRVDTSSSWRYYIIDAPTALLEHDAVNSVYKPNANGDYIIDTLFIEQVNGGENANLYFDIAFIAFASNLDEVDSLISNDVPSVYSVTKAYPTGATNVNSNTAKVTETVTNGKIQHVASCSGACKNCGFPGLSPTTDHYNITTTSDSNVYTTTCADCGKVVATKNFGIQGVTINKLLTPDWLATKKQGGGGTATHFANNGVWMANHVGTEYIWMREVYDKRAWSLGGGGSIDVGNSEYIVIRVKSGTAGKKIQGRVSTTGYNIEDTNGADATQASISSMVTYGTCTKADTWYTFYVKMTDKTSGAGGKVWVKDDTTNTYVIDTLTLNSYNNVDIAYIAFVETLTEAQALVTADGNTTPIPGDGEESTEATTVETETRPPEPETEAETEIEYETGTYSNGSGLTEAGANFTDGLFASSFKKLDESKAVSISAADLLTKLENNTLKLGEVYRVTGALNLAPDTTYYGNFAAIIAENGVTINDASGTSLRELIIKGSVSITNSSDIDLYKVEVKGGSTGITVDASSSNIMLSNCLVSASGTALVSSGEWVSVYQSRLVGDKGISSIGSDMTVQECLINATTCGISSSGQYFIAKNNTVTVKKSSGTGIELSAGSINSMAALNEIKNAQTSILATNSYNCTVILNEAVSISASNNEHLSVIKNRLGGQLSFSNNDYLIADGSTFISDGKYHPIEKSGNTNFNGDNLHDVDARLGYEQQGYGADEDLLPHTDPDRFLGMEIRTEITDLSSSSTDSYNSYVRAEALDGDIVIVPPGSYYTSSKIAIGKKQSNTSFYMYGANVMATFSHGRLLEVNNTENVNISGFTSGFIRSTCGQVQVLAVDAANKTLKVVVSAGFDDGFYTLNNTSFTDDCHYNPEFLSAYHMKNNADLSDIDAADVYGGHGSIDKSREDKGVVDNKDGTYTLYMTSTEGCQKILPGDVFVTRLGMRGQQTIITLHSDNVHYKDMTLFPISNGNNIAQYSRGVVFERLHTTRPSGYEISEEEYNKYVELGNSYGLDLGVSYDEEFGIYRGPVPIWGGPGAMEINSSYEGTTVISSRIDSCTDDGSNQRGSSSRIAAMVNNHDGTYTVYYKGNLATVARGNTSNNPNLESANVGSTPSLEVGDIIAAYTLDGKVLFDNAIVKTAPIAGSPEDVHIIHTVSDNSNICTVCGKEAFEPSESYRDQNPTYDSTTGDLTFQMKRAEGGGNTLFTWKTKVYSVTIDSKYVNEGVAENFDLLYNGADSAKRIALDNISKNCSGVHFDNVLLCDIKSRGLLAKVRDVEIEHCTFRDLTLQALVIGAEQEWNEGTVAKNVIVENCLFDNCAKTTEYNKANLSGYDADPTITPIDIRGVGSTSEDVLSNITPHNEMLASNFVIRNNKFINTPNKHLICVTGARHVTIEGNVFDERENDGEIVYINGCANIEIANNTYSDRIQGLMNSNINDAFDIYNAINIVVEGEEFARVTEKP